MPTTEHEKAIFGLYGESFDEAIERARKQDPAEKMIDGIRLYQAECERIRDGLRHRNPLASPVQLELLYRQHVERVRSLTSAREFPFLQ